MTRPEDFEIAVGPVEMTEESRNPSNSLLDPEQIQMLVESGAQESIEMFLEILSLFEEESEQKFVDLKRARETSDYEAFGRAAHALAGSSANIGRRVVWLPPQEMGKPLQERKWPPSGGFPCAAGGYLPGNHHSAAEFRQAAAGRAKLNAQALIRRAWS